MGTAPNGWQTPKTDWQAADVVQPADFNRVEGNIQAVEQGDRTIDPTQTPTGVVGTLRQLLDWLSNRIKAIMGTTNWYDAPPTTLTAAKGHMDAASPHSGHATTGALSSHTGETSAHSATSAATASRIMMRDSAGRAKVAAPSAADDIARLDSITKTQVGLGNVTNDKQATKAEFDAKMHATTGHKHTGVAGDGSKLDPATGLVWQPARSATGQYKGDDAASREIIVGFAPRLVVVAVNSATAVLLIPSRVVPLNYLTNVMQNNYLTSTGFTVGTSIGDKNLNNSSATYFWVALG